MVLKLKWTFRNPNSWTGWPNYSSFIDKSLLTRMPTNFRGVFNTILDIWQGRRARTRLSRRKVARPNVLRVRAAGRPLYTRSVSVAKRALVLLAEIGSEITAEVHQNRKYLVASSVGGF
ncbi:Hypothetical predicted protein [Cloeon dipterum]|uniref:Uncharacterized protein n=1 Tax=Cloeon dipterum TaxID=197152 RepID=A0A8S1DJB2_9INSE|nr:Hypothetical predicted protein [Cloeon dipterum]